jgi:hydroxyacylglutathione hydrolase
MSLFPRKSQWFTSGGYRITRVNRSRSKVFLVSRGNSHILVDTGVSRNWRKLRKDLEKLNVQSIKLLVLTHSHFDHAGNALRIKEKYGARIVIHAKEAGLLEQGFTPLPAGTNFFSSAIIRRLGSKASRQFRYRSCKADILINGKTDLSEYGFDAFILPTPGHTAGSVSLIVDDEIAIAGDSIFGVFRGSVFPPFADDVPEMIRSWGKLLETGCRLFIPTHGTPDSRELLQREYRKRKSLVLQDIN